MQVCKRVLYSGRVQGVGFRYTAHGVSEGFGVSGYVRNLPSGDVELVAQGAPGQVDAFLAAVERQMAGYIEAKNVHEHPPIGYSGFQIRA